MSDIRRESPAVLDSITENYFNGALKRERNYDIPVYAPPKETILKEMAAKIE
jgi:hypothetical protein